MFIRDSRGIIKGGMHFDTLDDSDFEATQDWLRAMFWEDRAPSIMAAYGANDEIALREGFNNWTDMLCKENVISNYVYENVTLEDD